MKPLVSVLIDTYNHERFIAEAIESVLGQSLAEAEREILVVDDGSTDRTPEIIHKFTPRVRMLRKENGGQASAFNAGIPECQGEIVAFLDGDDWWTQGKLVRVVEALATEPEVGLVGHGITEVYVDGREHTELLKECPRFRIQSEEGARTFRRRKSFLGTSRMTVRAEILRRIGLVPEELKVQADEYLSTLASVLADTMILRESLTYYRLHESNGFQVGDGNVTALRRKYRVLDDLADALRRSMKELNVAAETTKAIVDAVQVEADLTRLTIENGWPFETWMTELRNYEIMCPDASLVRRLLKCVSLLPACVLPSRTYYELRQGLSNNTLYRRARRRWLPFSEPMHVDRYRTSGLEER